MCGRARHVLDRLQAGQRVAAIDVHRAGPADALPARTTEGQGGIDVVLDVDQRVQDHRADRVQIDLVGVQARILAVIGAPAIDLELADPLGAGGRLVDVALADLAVLRKGEGGHVMSGPVITASRRASSAGTR
jgi:hypothetical protein